VPYSFTGSWPASLPDMEGYAACATSALAAGDAVALTELTGVLLTFLTCVLRARCRRGALLIHRELARLSAGQQRLRCLPHECAGLCHHVAGCSTCHTTTVRYESDHCPELNV